MKVAFISHTDYANLGFNLSEALNASGVYAKAFALKPHEFGYERQAERILKSELRLQLLTFDVIFICHSLPELLELVPPGKRVMVLHTGTRYRQNPEKLNAIFNPVVERTFTDSPEFCFLGGKDVTYIATPVDTEKIQPVYNNNPRPVFAHYPSNPEVKGTKKIIEMMSAFDVEFICDTAVVSHEENLKRMAGCDVYIELFAPYQNGKPYGSAGVTAWEAAAIGKEVITNFAHTDVYFDAYKACPPFLIANDEVGFAEMVRSSLRNLHKWQSNEVLISDIIEDRHSMKATGEYLKQYL